MPNESENADLSSGASSPSSQAAGAVFAEAVDVMNRLRAPNGCPWDAEQTHASLIRYLIEECYELVQAIEDGNPRGLREELGDVLLQVLFHARIASESLKSDGGFDISDVTRDLVAKLISRHPHVFGGSEQIGTSDAQQQRWEELKKLEPGRSSALAGVATAAPALALASKLGARSKKFGLLTLPPDGDSAAEQIFRLAYNSGKSGEDLETLVREVARSHASRMLIEESGDTDA